MGLDDLVPDRLVAETEQHRDGFWAEKVASNP